MFLHEIFKIGFMKTVKFAACIFVLLLFETAIAQEMPIYNQYLLNRNLLNPANVGVETCPSLRITDRHQWLGLENAPSSQTVTFSTRAGNNGLGFAFMRDVNGVNSFIGGKFTYAYHITLFERWGKPLLLSFGTSASVYNFRLDESGFTPIENDPLVTGGISNSMYLNADAGMYLFNRNFFLGLSVAEIIPSSFVLLGNSSGLDRGRNYFLTYGYRKLLSENLALVPSIMIKLNETGNYQTDFNIRLYWIELLHGAVSYRRNIDKVNSKGNSILALIGTKIGQNTTLAYQIEFGLNRLQLHNLASHEFLLGFIFCKPKKVIPCPAFYD